MSRISVMVKQSCTSAQSTWLGSIAGHGVGPPAAIVVARNAVKVLFSCRYGWSVATPKPGDVHRVVGELLGALRAHQQHGGGTVGLGTAVEQVQG